MAEKENESLRVSIAVPALLVVLGFSSTAISYKLGIQSVINFDKKNPLPDTISHTAFKSYCGSILKKNAEHSSVKMLKACQNDDKNPKNVTREVLHQACAKMPEKSLNNGIQKMVEFCEFNKEIMQEYNLSAEAIIKSMPLQKTINGIITVPLFNQKKNL